MHRILPAATAVMVVVLAAVAAPVAPAIAQTASTTTPTTTAAAPPPAETEAIAVTPDTALTDGQLVTVDGTGFPPQEFIQVTECPADALPDGPRCIYVDFFGAGTDDVGAFSDPVELRAVLDFGDGTSFDCRDGAGTCVLRAGAASVPLSFDPSAPLEPPATLTVTPSTGLVNGQRVALEGRGFTPGTAYGIAQCAGAGEDPTRCLPLSVDAAPVPGSGVIRVSVLVSGGIGTIDCRTTTCVFVIGGGGRQATAILRFAPVEPAPATPIVAPPDFTG